MIHITEETVKNLLDWTSVVSAVEVALASVSQNLAVQKPRTFTNVLGSKDILLSMPGYLDHGEKKTLACKLVTAFPNNEYRDPPLSSVLAHILLFDEQTGQLKSVIEATEITAWRTAAASVVATKYLHSLRPNRQNNILAILGAGIQGRIHAIAFHNIFKFNEIHIWNHRYEKAKKLAEELQSLGIPARSFVSGKECVENADVIITVTFASNPILHLEWIKPNAHINAVGAGTHHYCELAENIYKSAVIYVDHMEGAKVELKGLEEYGVELTASVGDLITGKRVVEDGRITIFHALGMAAEDAAVGQLIYDKHISQIKNNK